MSFLKNLLGYSKLQEDFDKSNILKLKLELYNITKYDLKINNNSVNKLNDITRIYFDFNENTLEIDGELFSSVFQWNEFNIKNVINRDGYLELALSIKELDNNVFMFIKVYRSEILFLGNRSNWDCRIICETKIQSRKF